MSRGASPSGSQVGGRYDRGGRASRSIGRGENRLDLGACQEVHLSPVVALARYVEHTLDQRAVCRPLKGHEPEERADSDQTQVARLRAVSRFAARSVRNGPMNVASNSTGVWADGGFSNRTCANMNSSRNVSL